MSREQRLGKHCKKGHHKHSKKNVNNNMEHSNSYECCFCMEQPFMVLGVERHGKDKS